MTNYLGFANDYKSTYGNDGGICSLYRLFNFNGGAPTLQGFAKDILEITCHYALEDEDGESEFESGHHLEFSEVLEDLPTFITRKLFDIIPRTAIVFGAITESQKISWKRFVEFQAVVPCATMSVTRGMNDNIVYFMFTFGDFLDYCVKIFPPKPGATRSVIAKTKSVSSKPKTTTKRR